MENAIAREYLRSVRKRFTDAKQTAERAIAQLTDEQLFWAPGAESNSIAVIIKHMSGNMISRWTDFFEADGEKPSRNRDGEFVMEEAATREATPGPFRPVRCAAAPPRGTRGSAP